MRVCYFRSDSSLATSRSKSTSLGRIPIPGVSSAHYAWSEIQLVPEIWKNPGSSACRDLSLGYAPTCLLDLSTSSAVFSFSFLPFRLRYPPCQLSTWRCSASALLTAFAAVSRNSSSATLTPPPPPTPSLAPSAKTDYTYHDLAGNVMAKSSEPSMHFSSSSLFAQKLISDDRTISLTNSPIRL